MVAGSNSGIELVAGLGPVDDQQADVGERVAERAELPVDDRRHLAGGREDHVVEPVVAVDDRRRPLLGDAGREAAVDLVTSGSSRVFDFSHCPASGAAGGRRSPLLAELAEADVVRVDGVDVDQRVDDPLADRAALGLARTARPRLGRAGSGPRRTP